MKNTNRIINSTIIAIVTFAILLILCIGAIGLINVANADTGSDLSIEYVDTEYAHIVKVKNILAFREAYGENYDYAAEKEIYEALGYSNEQINAMTVHDFEKLYGVDEIEAQHSDFYVGETPIATRSDSEDASREVTVQITNPSSGQGVASATQGMKKSVSLSLMIRRYSDNDRVATVTNKDGSTYEKTYFGVRIDMSLLWIDGPSRTYKDNLFVFSDKEMTAEKTILSSSQSSKVLTAIKGTNYYKYVEDLPDGEDVRYTGEYDYEIDGSESFNFRVVYLHHSSPSLGFDNRVTVRTNDMDVDVDNVVFHTKFKSYIYTINLV